MAKGPMRLMFGRNGAYFRFLSEKKGHRLHGFESVQIRENPRPGVFFVVFEDFVVQISC